MTIHDTWADLKIDGSLSEIIYLFPDQQIPLRDPFPLAYEQEGVSKLDQYIVDVERLNSFQYEALYSTYFLKQGVGRDAFINTILEAGGFPVTLDSIGHMYFGPEAYQRMIEFLDFMEQKNQKPSKKDIISFTEQQLNKWIYQDTEVQPLPEKFEDYDPRFQTPELLMALEFQKIAARLQIETS